MGLSTVRSTTVQRFPCPWGEGSTVPPFFGEIAMVLTLGFFMGILLLEGAVRVVLKFVGVCGIE